MTDVPTRVGQATVYDHSEFGVSLVNRHPEPIRVLEVVLRSIGDVERSGLGDIVDYWPWEGGERLLDPGGGIWFERVWGFSVDTPNTVMTYRFEIEYELVDSAETVRTMREVVLRPSG